MKKFTLFLFTLVIGFITFCTLVVKADAITITLTEAASIRPAGNQGLRFAATASEDFDGNTEHGFYIAIGRHTKAEMTAAIAGGTGSIGGHTIVKKDTRGTDKDFAVTVIDIPEANYGTEITAIAYYVHEDANVYSNVAFASNFITVAKTLVDGGSENATYVAIANTAKVTVTATDSSVRYYATIDNQLIIEDYDTITLAAGTYSNNFTVSANHVTIEGNKEFNLKHNDEYIVSGDDSIFNCVVTITGDYFDLSSVVFSKKIDLNGADHTAIHNCVTTTTNATYPYAIGTVGSESSYLTVTNVAVAGTVNRFIYGYSAVLNGLTVDSCCVLDSADMDKDTSLGVCDFIRLGQSEENKSKGIITIQNCYIRAFQSGFQDRNPGGNQYNFLNNYYYNIPNAIYAKSVSTKTGIVYNVMYNTFNSCLKSYAGWDVVEIDPSVSKTVNINYNAFANTGTRPSCYSISVLGTATVDCTNNYFKAGADRVVNLVTPTDWSLEEAITDGNTYDAYKIVQIGGKYYISSVNLNAE